MTVGNNSQTVGKNLVNNKGRYADIATVQALTGLEPGDFVVIEDITGYDTNPLFNLSPELSDGDFDPNAADYLAVWDGSTWEIIDQDTGGGGQTFQIGGEDFNRGLVGTIGLEFQALAFNVENAPVTWSLDTFSGDILNVSIDSVTGLITYDIPESFTNDSFGLITVSATDTQGNVVTHTFKTEAADPISRVALACNADIAANLPDIQSKFIFSGMVEPDSLYTDLAKTTLALDGDTVLVWEDGNGNGDATVRAGDVGPSYNVGGAPNGRDALSFSGSNEAIQYDVPGAPSAGAPFKLFFFVRIDPTSNNNDACVMSSTSQANNNALTNQSWQISRSSNTDNFVFRTHLPSTVIFGTAVTSNDTLIVPWTSNAKNGQWHLCYVEYDGTQVSVFWDGDLKLIVQVSPLAAEHFKFFENRDGGSYLAGDLGELIFADDTLTQSEATQVQAYFACKFGLDASLLSDPGPFSINKSEFYGQLSQFELVTFSNGDEYVYDKLNGTYLPNDDVPVPDLGMFLDAKTAAILERASINPVYQDLQVEVYRGRSTNGTTQSFASNSSMIRTGVGQWTVNFTTTHPEGVNYTPHLVTEEQGTIRDTPYITVVQGSQTANGFQIQIVEGDNGGAADAYTDAPWSYGVEAPIAALVGV